MTTTRPKPITVVMTTYDPGDGARMEMARQAIHSLLRYMTPRPDVIHIADDGSPREMLKELVAGFADRFGEVLFSVSQTPRLGIGGSLNAALRVVLMDSLWLYTVDDWVLTGVLDLTQAVQLITDCDYDYVRLGPIHPNLQCVTKFQAGVGWWLDIDPLIGFAFATRPFLATMKLASALTPFPERCDSYEHEARLSARCAGLSWLKIAQTGSVTLAGPWDNLDMDGKLAVGQVVDPAWAGSGVKA